MQAELRHLSHQILKTQEEERKRISRELHDEITQILVGIRVHLETLAGEAASDPALLRRKIARTRRLVEKSVDVVHQFARELRPPTLDHLGLVSTLHAFLKDFMNRTGIRVRLTAFNGLEEMSLDRRTVLYRVAHEALTNVERHAGASQVEVCLRRQPGLVRMTVTDDGKSFDTVHALRPRRNGRLGLLGMRERLEMVGGSLSIQSAPGKGTTITADVPFGTVRRKGVHTVAK
jgi:two-component system, NarL family, sensor histidine kinase DegS